MNGRSCILTYHSLDRSGSVISIAPEVFREQMAWLAETGARVVSLDRVRETPGSVAITFDDGFRNFFEHALPALREYRFPATVFVVSGFCGGRNDWPSQPRGSGVPDLELMSWQEVEQASQAGITIGCHTVTHPRLARLSAADLEQELSASRAGIEQRIGSKVDSFAYPYGESSPGVREAAERHFRFACGTKMAFLTADSDLLNLPRLDVYYLRDRLWFRGLGRAYGTAYLAGRAWLRGLRGQ